MAFINQIESEKKQWLTVLETAQEELVKLMEDKKMIERHINKLQSDIQHLAALCNVTVENPIAQLGLTDAIRYLLLNSKKPLEPTEIRDWLLKSHGNAANHANLLASVHTIMKRLIKSGEARMEGNGICVGLPPPPGNFKKG